MATTSAFCELREQAIRGTLCAVLLNPSLSTQDTISHSNLGVASKTLGFEGFQIVNLVQVPSRNSKDLALVAASEDDWLKSRPEIDRALKSADEVVFAWGASRLTGEANRHKEEQITWTIQRTLNAGHSEVLLMDGSPRHPSRWRQYVGPQKKRVAGDTLEDRFRAVLNRHPVDTLQSRGKNRLSGVRGTIRQASSINEEMDPTERGRRTS
jgi:hypothetical protein